MTQCDRLQRSRKLLNEFELTILWDLAFNDVKDGVGQKARQIRRRELLRELASLWASADRGVVRVHNLWEC